MKFLVIKNFIKYSLLRICLIMEFELSRISLRTNYEISSIINL